MNGEVGFNQRLLRADGNGVFTEYAKSHESTPGDATFAEINNTSTWVKNYLQTVS